MADSHGRFIWYELMTTDMEAAKAFYSKVVGWGTQDVSTPAMAYTLFTVAGSSVSGLMRLPEDAKKIGESRAGSDMSGLTMWTPPPTALGASGERCMFHRGTSSTSAAFRSSPTRKWQRLRCCSG